MINNPYQTTPMMNNNYMPMQNPYADRMNFLQNYQQSLQQQPMQMNQQPMPQQIAGINGRIVQAVENINANEVPMDGSMADLAVSVATMAAAMLQQLLHRLIFREVSTIRQLSVS